MTTFSFILCGIAAIVFVILIFCGKYQWDKIKDYQEELKELESQTLASQDCLTDLEKNITDHLERINGLNSQIGDLDAELLEHKNNVALAIDAAKHEKIIHDKIDFYRLNIDETDKEDIKKLRSIEPQLAHPEVLDKMIWKVYYENKTSDLIGRVIGNQQKTGIYKITNISNGMCYIGQSVNLASRWRQHIKRGIGAEAPTQNKLYPAMRKFGPENFVFQILEECSPESLDVREDYWQDYYQAKEYGYSIK